MSLADVSMRRCAAAFNVVHADTWSILSGSLAGSTFEADAQTESVVSLDGDMGSDAREKTILFVDRPAPLLERGMVLSGKGRTWRVIGDKDDNAANDRVKFELVQISSKDT
jgi:hypothetical protein